LIYLAAGLAANLSDASRLVYAPVFLLISFALYYAGFWRAGDGKLFFCTSLFILPLTGDFAGRIFLDLVLAISLCYITLFLLLFSRTFAAGKICEAFALANKKTVSLKTAARIIAFAIFSVSAGSLLPEGYVLPIALLLAYVAAARIPTILYAVVLLLIPLALLGQHAVGEYAIALVFLSAFVYFFNLYQSIRQVSRSDGEMMPFAPFLFISTAVVVLI
jgi:hypothetical protein